MRLQFWFAVATRRGSGFRIPALPKAEFDRLVWSDIIGLPLRGGRGEDSAGDSLGSSADRRVHLKKAYLSQDRWILTGAARDGVFAVNLKC